MDFRHQSQGNLIDPFLLRGHAKKAAGIFEIMTDNPIVAVKQQARLVDGGTDDGQSRLAIVHEKGCRIDAFLGVVSFRIASSSSGSSPLMRPMRRPLTSHARLSAGGIICSSATRQTMSLIVGSPNGRGTIATLSRQRLGSIVAAAMPTNASDQAPGPFPFLSSAQPPTISSPETAVAVNRASHTDVRFFAIIKRNPFRGRRMEIAGECRTIHPMRQRQLLALDPERWSKV